MRRDLEAVTLCSSRAFATQNTSIMSNHRIHIIAVLSAISICAASSLTAQTNAGTKSQGQEPASSKSSNSGTTGTATPRSDDSTSTSAASPTSSTPSSSTNASTAVTSSESSQRAASGSGQSSSEGPASGEVKRATDDSDQSTVAKLKGQRIRSSDGSELGKVHDFIVDGSSGTIVHIVVSTGGLVGLGDKLRLLSP